MRSRHRRDDGPIAESPTEWIVPTRRSPAQPSVWGALRRTDAGGVEQLQPQPVQHGEVHKCWRHAWVVVCQWPGGGTEARHGAARPWLSAAGCWQGRAVAALQGTAQLG